MTGKKVFWQRLREEIKYQMGVFRSVFDWTVISYIAIPTLIVFPFFYRDVWINVHLYWHEKISINLIVFILLLVLSRGNFRSFIQEADLLFIVQNKVLYQSFKRWGLYYSISQIILSTTVFIVLLLPILHSAYQYSFNEILFLYSFLMIYRFIQLTLKKLIVHNILKGFLLTIVFFLSLYTWQVIPPSIVIGGTIVVIITIYYLHHITFVTSNNFFNQELDIELTERVRYIQLIFSFSREVEKTPRRYFKKPIFFFPSKRIFRRTDGRRESGLLEVLLKRFCRDRVLMMGYLNLVSISLIAIYFVSPWLKWVVYSFFIFAVSAWLRSVYEHLLAHSFFTVVQYDKNIYVTTGNLFRKLLAMPMILFVGCLTIIFSFF